MGVAYEGLTLRAYAAVSTAWQPMEPDFDMLGGADLCTNYISDWGTVQSGCDFWSLCLQIDYSRSRYCIPYRKTDDPFQCLVI